MKIADSLKRATPSLDKVIERIKKTAPDEIFSQLELCELLSVEAKVFRQHRAELQEYTVREGGRVYYGSAQSVANFTEHIRKVRGE